MKNNRLFGIIYILMLKKTVAAKELAERFEVSVRTIYRDIELLSSMNVPVYMTKGKNGGISLLDGYKLDKAMFTEEEQNQILFALQGFNKLSANDIAVFDKMKAVFDKDNKNWIDIDFTVWGKSAVQKSSFETIKQAILQAKKIKFVYFNSYGEKSKRKVEPLQICFKYNAWYLFAYDDHKQDYRMFKLSRIKDIEITERSFDRKMPEKRQDSSRKVKTISFVMEVSREMAYRVYDEFEESNIEIMENGNFRISAQYPENDWVYGYILSFGEYAKVLYPEALKNIVREKLNKSIKNY